MRRTEALQGVRMTVFLNLVHRWESAELNQEEAAELLSTGYWGGCALTLSILPKCSRL